MNVTETLSEQGRKPTGMLGWITALAMPLVFRSLYGKVAARLHLTPDDEVLDVGCGSGDFLRLHAAHARRIAGVDHSALEVTLARRRNHRRVGAGTAQVVEADATALPWPDDSFTAVTCNCVQCFDDPQRSLQEMRRVLRPGGRAVLVMQGRGERVGERDRWGMPLWTKAEVEQMTTAAGFSPVEVTADGDVWFVDAGKPESPLETAHRPSGVLPRTAT